MGINSPSLLKWLVFILAFLLCSSDYKLGPNQYLNRILIFPRECFMCIIVIIVTD